MAKPQTKPQPAAAQRKPVNKAAAADNDDSDIEEDIDYDEVIPDDSGNEKIENQFKIGGSHISKPAKESPPQEPKKPWQKDKADGNKLLNQFHTVKKEEPKEEEPAESEVEAEGEGEGEEDEEENKALVETLIRLYRNDPESLGEFERELVENELKARGEPVGKQEQAVNKSTSKESLKPKSKDTVAHNQSKELKTDSVQSSNRTKPVNVASTISKQKSKEVLPSNPEVIPKENSVSKKEEVVQKPAKKAKSKSKSKF